MAPARPRVAVVVLGFNRVLQSSLRVVYDSCRVDIYIYIYSFYDYVAFKRLGRR